MEAIGKDVTCLNSEGRCKKFLKAIPGLHFYKANYKRMELNKHFWLVKLYTEDRVRKYFKSIILHDSKRFAKHCYLIFTMAYVMTIIIFIVQMTK